VRNAPVTVLVVDDEETICQIVTRALQEEGLVCVTAHSGEAALEWLRTSKPWPDLFIVDVRLPGMSGPEFVIEAVRIRQGAPVLYISAFAQAMLEDHPTLSDAVAFLPKPFTHAQLLGAVRRLLSVESPASSAR
jgi:two-component system cell cycle sensor histidine kinase/response regulator CckA